MCCHALACPAAPAHVLSGCSRTQWLACPWPPLQVRTHLRNMIIIPEMIGSVVGVYNGKTFNQVGMG